MPTEQDPKPKEVMPAEIVVALYRLFEANHIVVWIDGGWGVDALLGEQTRPHSDLDIAIRTTDLPKMRDLLEAIGYRDKERDDTCAWNFVLADNDGHAIDVHAIDLDDQGNGIYGPPENGAMYPASALMGTGYIKDQEVRCISAEDMVKFHIGYELDEVDFHDVSALCEKYNLAVPEEYTGFMK